MRPLLWPLLAITCALSAPSRASQAEYWAHRILEHRLAMSSAKTVFERWQADQWASVALQCHRHAQVPVPHTLANMPFLSRAGSVSLLRDPEASCAALAQGPKPACYGLTSTVPPFSTPPAGLPADYAFVSAKLVTTAPLEVTVGGYCELVAGVRDTRRFLAAPGTFTWRVAPREQSFMTRSGPRVLKAGSGEFRVEGAPAAAPVTVVVLP